MVRGHSKIFFPTLPSAFGVAPFPSGPVRKVTLATTDGFGIYAGTKHPEAAWELMKFLISKDYGRAMARADFLQPARASLVGDWIGYVQEQFPQAAKDVDLAAFAEGQLKGYSVVAEVFPNMARRHAHRPGRMGPNSHFGSEAHREHAGCLPANTGRTEIGNRMAPKRPHAHLRTRISDVVVCSDHDHSACRGSHDLFCVPTRDRRTLSSGGTSSWSDFQPGNCLRTSTRM